MHARRQPRIASAWTFVLAMVFVLQPLAAIGLPCPASFGFTFDEDCCCRVAQPAMGSSCCEAEEAPAEPDVQSCNCSLDDPEGLPTEPLSAPDTAGAPKSLARWIHEHGGVSSRTIASPGASLATEKGALDGHRTPPDASSSERRAPPGALANLLLARGIGGLLAALCTALS